MTWNAMDLNSSAIGIRNEFILILLKMQFRKIVR